MPTAPPPPAPPARTASVIVAADRPLAAFRPANALGAGLDGHDHGDTRLIYTAANLRAMGSAGFGPITYRLRTELAVEAWHVDPRGSWSDPRRRQGYFTPSPSPSSSPAVTFGYRLPRRGDTIDQANDDGYSRLDDGRHDTFWKSNPYLDPHYAHGARPQRVQVDFGRPRAVDALRVDWGTPWATRVRVQWWSGPSAILLAGHPPGRWRDFPRAAARGRGGTQTFRLARAPRRVRFVRVLLERSSHTAPPGSRDVRDRLGYAIRELALGTLAAGRFHDLMRHGAANDRQTVTMTSSTDPWHRATDRDPHTEQPGFATVMRSGLTHRRPVLVPVPVLYGTPAAAVAELRYLRALHVPIAGVELGEEPDGQLAVPEDYAALYAQFAGAIRRYDPALRLGGPGLQTSIPDWLAWPDRHGDRSWTHRFLRALRARHVLRDLAFFSFEWYPFDNVCADASLQLRRAPGMLSAVLARQRAHGLSPHVPEVITEYGFSAFSGRAEVDRQGALFDAETAAQFLTLGGDRAYFYGLEPDILIREATACDTWGNLVLFLADYRRRITQPTAAYWAMRMVTRDWLQRGAGVHEALATTTTVDGDRRLLSAYAVLRPDRRIGVLLINKDPRRAMTVTVQAPFAGPVRRTTLSAGDYTWHPRGGSGVARPDRAPRSTLLPTPPSAGVSLPPMSLTVLAG